MNEFGTLIRKLRNQKKMTLRDLAEYSKLSYSFIASLEKGRYNPSRESIYALASPLDGDVNELLMLAGFFPDQSRIADEHKYTHSTVGLTKSKVLELENILEMEVTFQGNELNKSDKIALIAFLQTVSGLKELE